MIFLTNVKQITRCIWFLCIIFCFSVYKCILVLPINFLSEENNVTIPKTDNADTWSQSKMIKLFKRDKNENLYFDKRIMSLRTEVVKGSTAFLICIVKNIQNESVSWIRNRDLHILTVNNYVFTNDNRFNIINDTPNNWTLRIHKVQENDTGIYDCQISRQPVISFSVYLTINEPKNLEIVNQCNNDTEDNFLNLVNDEEAKLPKLSREYFENTKILDGSEKYIKEGEPINITCVVIGDFKFQSYQPQIQLNSFLDPSLHLIWFHNDTIIHENTSRNGTSVNTKYLTRMIQSSLIILNSYLNDSGNYVCHSPRFNEAIITVYVTNGNESSLIGFSMFLYILRVYLITQILSIIIINS